MSPPNRGELALTTARWKWIRRTRGHHSLFDLENDPHELVDVASKHPEVAAGLDRQLLERVRDQRARCREIYGSERRGARLSKEAEEQLRAELAKLGYTEDDAAAEPEHPDADAESGGGVDPGAEVDAGDGTDEEAANGADGGTGDGAMTSGGVHRVPERGRIENPPR
jgi:hypothetical protein